MPQIHQLTFLSKNGKKGNLEIDDNGNLYWNKKPVITKSKVTLKWWVDCAVIIGALSTLVIAIYTALIFYYN